MEATTALREPIVWINVTTSVAWTRPAVGIVRVERALALHIQNALGPDACKLCIWQDGRFVEWVPPNILPLPAEVESAMEVILPRGASFDLARPFVLRALQRHKALSTPAAADGVLEDASIASPTRLHPQRGDFLISVGLDWDNQYTERFYDLSRKGGLRIITCCYDLIPVLFPHFCVGEVAKRFTEYFIQLSWGSEAVLCISEQTQADYTALCKELGAPRRQTLVMPLGDNVPSADGVVGALVESIARSPFILFVSTIERRKNHEVLYRAYHVLARRGLTKQLPTLVFVGMPGWGVGDLLKDIEIDPITKGLILQLHHVTDAELNHLYSHAAFCVYPSLYEGWGLPVGEALAMGKAVIASSEGSLPEVGGDLVRYVPPWDVYAWADAMLELIEHPRQLAEMEEAICLRYRPRDWKDTAASVIDLIQNMRHAKYPNGIVLQPGYDMATHAGMHVGPAICASNCDGLLLFGPHWPLPAGRYAAMVYAKVEQESGQRMRFEITSSAGQRVHQTQQVSIAGPLLVGCIAQLHFELPLACDDVEVRCFVDSQASLCIERIEIQQSDGIAGLEAEALSPEIASTT